MLLNITRYFLPILFVSYLVSFTFFAHVHVVNGVTIVHSHVTLPELMDGEDAAEDSVRVYDDEQILDLLRRTQELERQKGVLCGFVLIVLGIASSALSKTTGGTDVQDFLSGILMGLSVAEILAGICVAGKKLLKQ